MVRSLLVGVFGLAGCTSPSESLALPPLPLSERAVVVPPSGGLLAEVPRATASPAPVEPAPLPTPPSAAAPVGPPTLAVAVRSDDSGFDETCPVEIEASGFPAYDAEGDVVLTLERYSPQMNGTDLGTLTARWIDAATGATIRTQTILEDRGGDSPCEAADRFARRRAKRFTRQIADVAWAPMSVVHPVYLTPWGVKVARDERQIERDDARADDREPDPPLREFQLLELDDGLAARVPGVKVYERGLPSLAIDDIFSRVHRFHADAASGTVLATLVDCSDDEDCTCNPHTSSEVMRWKPETIAALAKFPCRPEAHGDDDACTSSFGGTLPDWTL